MKFPIVSRDNENYYCIIMSDLTYVHRLFIFSMKISWQDKDP